MKLFFPIPFNKRISKEVFGTLPECDECGSNVPKGENYYFFAGVLSEDFVPNNDDKTYLLCKKCAMKKK